MSALLTPDHCTLCINFSWALLCLRYLLLTSALFALLFLTWLLLSVLYTPDVCIIQYNSDPAHCVLHFPNLTSALFTPELCSLYALRNIQTKVLNVASFGLHMHYLILTPTVSMLHTPDRVFFLCYLIMTSALSYFTYSWPLLSELLTSDLWLPCVALNPDPHSLCVIYNWHLLSLNNILLIPIPYATCYWPPLSVYYLLLTSALCALLMPNTYTLWSMHSLPIAA